MWNKEIRDAVWKYFTSKYEPKDYPIQRSNLTYGYRGSSYTETYDHQFMDL